MKVYKGTDKDIKCRGYQFEQGVTAVEEKAELYSSGFHACEAPLDVFAYYPPASSRYFEAELEDVSPERHSDDTKVVGKKITLGAELTVPMLCKAQFQYVKEHTITEHTDPKQATAGFRGAATAGESGAATAGESGAATAGNYGAATAGESGAATAGNYGAATAGESGAATAGNYGAATSRGSVSVGKNGCALVRCVAPKARGGIGAVLFLCREKSWLCSEIAAAAEIIIDGETYKPDTWYTLTKDGEIVTVNEADGND